MKPNFIRMLQLIEEVFAVRNDPTQLDVDESVIEKLGKIHPATLSERANEDGPIAWVLLIPTTKALMDQFLGNEITEKELFERTEPGQKYEAIYLCSATVLEEFRGKHLGFNVTIEAIDEIRKDHEIKTLFVWPFSKEGERLAERIAKHLALELKIKLQ